MILRNKIAQFLLHLPATLSKVIELCSLNIHQFPAILSPILHATLKGKSCPNPKLKMMMQLLKTMLQLLVQLNMFRDLSE